MIGCICFLCWFIYYALVCTCFCMDFGRRIFLWIYNKYPFRFISYFFNFDNENEEEEQFDDIPYVEC